MSPENFSPETPYWSFWKVVFAGWLIKYPGTFFRGLMWIVIIMLFGGVYVHSEYVTEPSQPETEMVKDM